MLAAIRSRPAIPVAGAAALAAVAFGHFYLNYDSFYALVWGRDVLHGRGPDYDLLLTPTPHPLLTLAGSFSTLFGTRTAPAVMSAMVVVSWVGLIAAVYLLGSRLFGAGAGAIAALVVATREPFVSWTVRGFVDLPFLALVVAAAAIEARRPRAGWPVLGLLTVAGLLRPEAWALAGLYWLWLWPGLEPAARVRTAALVASAPLAWALFDLVTAGDAIHSFTGTRDNVDALGRPTGLDDVPYRFARLLGYLTQEPGIVGAAGAVAAVLLVPLKARLPAAMFGAGLAVFALFGLAGLPLIDRYLTVPATMLLVFCGAALTGWKDMEPGSGRTRWRALAIVAAAGLVITIPFQANRLSDLHGRSVARGAIQDDLRRLARDPRSRPVLERCPRVYVSNHRPIPILAWWLDRSPAAFHSAAVERPRNGAFVAPANARVKRLFTLDRRDPTPLDAKVPRSFNRVSRNASWVLYEQPGGC